jgi:hypothetical protein
MCLAAIPSPEIIAIFDIPVSPTDDATAGAFCAALDPGPPAGVAVEITGPLGATGIAGPTGPAGAAGGTGGTGRIGNTGIKGVQGPTGIQGGSGGTGGTGSNGALGATGPVGGAPTGPTGGPGGSGSTGIIGPQGPSGAQGATGPTAIPAPTFIDQNPGTELAAGPGDLGNTNTGLSGTGPSQIIVTCPLGTNLISGGAELLPGNADVRGILESSFPNPAIANQWIVTAEVTATGTTADSPSSNFLEVLPYANCQTIPAST